MTNQHQGWQPIASAPRDGSSFLAFIDGEHVEMVHHSVQSWVITNHGMKVEPTHWLPLPPPPEQEGGL